tara:strand:- start:50 stop:250 length:201 start_codon:yes stop_codon:yes gene_type:complete
MNVGDLVRFKSDLVGMTGHVGLVVAFNGEGGVDVMWLSGEAQWRHRGDDFAMEMKMFLEVISEEDA